MKREQWLCNVSCWARCSHVCHAGEVPCALWCRAFAPLVYFCCTLPRCSTYRLRLCGASRLSRPCPCRPIALQCPLLPVRTALTIRPAASEAEIAVRPSREVYRKMTCETRVASLAASPACPASASLQLVPSPTRRHAKTAAGHQCQMCSAPASPSPQSGHAP